jgi:hypothetical protein
MLDVVRLSPSHGPVAAVPSATLGLLQLQLATQRSVRKAHRPAQFHGFTGGVVEHRGDHPGFASEEAGTGNTDRLPFQHGQAAGVFALQGLDVHHEVEGGCVPMPSSGLGRGPVPGEELVEGFGVAVRLRGQQAFAFVFAAGLGVLLARGRAGGLQVLVEQSPGRLGQGAFQVPHAVAGLGEFEPLEGLLTQVVEQFGLLGDRGPQLIEVPPQVLEGSVLAVLGDHGLRCGAQDVGVEGGSDWVPEWGAGEESHGGGLVELADGVGDLVDPCCSCRCRLGQDPELP